MKKPIPALAVIAGGAIIIAILALSTPDEPEPIDTMEDIWPSSGPFAINKLQYKLGEKIFVSINGMTQNDIGVILWQTPEGLVSNTTPFDGSQKSAFNTYYEPDTSRFTGAYDVDQLVGVWTLNFTGTNYLPLQFEVIDEFIPGSEKTIFDIPRPNSTG